MTSGELFELVFDLLPTSTIVRRGDEIEPRDQRSRFATADDPSDITSARVTVCGGGGYASCVQLPDIPAEKSQHQSQLIVVSNKSGKIT
jgi:hypothetical protein